MHRKAKQRVTSVILMLMLVSASFARLPRVQASSGEGLVLTSPLVQASTEPVTFTTSGFGEVLTLDPQRVEDSISINPVENLFLGLLDVDPRTADVRPEIATKWERSTDGKTWTFTLRDDIPWVRYDMNTKQTTELRKVTARDFEYGIKRSCDPRLNAFYTSVAAAVLQGCETVSRLNAAEVKDSVFDQIGVKALSDTQLQITTRGAFGYFPSLAAMWMFRAVPRESIAEFGDNWTDPDKIVSNGPYVIDEWDQQVSRVYVQNPLYPKNVTDRYGGNVEKVVELLSDSAYTLYQNGEIDFTYAPSSDLNALRADPTTAKELIQRVDLATFYFGFMYDKPPFDNVHVRRAFSAIIDRKAFVESQIAGLGVPIAHFMPPGIRGAVPINEVGIGNPDNLGFDPDYAKKELAASPYPDCKDFPNITIMTYSTTPDWGEVLITAAETYLGCDKAKFVVESADFGRLLQAIKRDVPTVQRPNMFTLGWHADYPDAQNWMHDVLSCKADNPFKRPCDAIDEKIDAAAVEADSDKRNQMYRELEEAFFGPSGDFPIAPLYVDVNILLVKPWVKGFFESDGQFGGTHFDSIQIDQVAQLAGRTSGGQ